MIIKEKAGELIHFDSYHLPRGLVKDEGKLYLVGGIDDATRIAWVELMPNITSLSAMFGSMQILRLLQDRYNIKPKMIMTDNGPEFKGSDVLKHPFERLLMMLEVKHIYTKPYKPQPNGKIERFWRTLYEDLLEEAEFKNIDELKDELQGYMLYYNELRPHQSLNNKSPLESNNICPRIA
jgi:transposase InsO family protein